MLLANLKLWSSQPPHALMQTKFQTLLIPQTHCLTTGSSGTTATTTRFGNKSFQYVIIMNFSPFQGHYVKDLDILGRDLSQVAIIDNSVEAMAFQLNNGVLIDDFVGDTFDRCLLDLLPLLDMMQSQSDVSQTIAQYYQSL